MRVQVQGLGLTRAAEGTGAAQVVRESGYKADLTKANNWKSLENALAGGGKLYTQVEQVRGEDARARADDYVNSMSTKELNDLVQSGGLPAQEHPAFLAYVNNRHYGNLAMDGFNKTRVAIESGELDFSGPDGQEKLDQHMQEVRKETLGKVGDNEYAVAGYDKVWQNQKDQLLTWNTKAVSTRILEDANGTLSQNFETAYGNGKDSAARADLLIGEFNAGVSAGLIPISGPRRKEALKKIAMVAAAKGDKELLGELKGKMIARPGEQGGQPLATLLGVEDWKEIELVGEREYLTAGKKAWEPVELTYRQDMLDGNMDEDKFLSEATPLVKSGIMSSDTVSSMLSVNRNARAQRGNRLIEQESQLEVERGISNYNAVVDKAILNAHEGTGSSVIQGYHYTDAKGNPKYIKPEDAAEEGLQRNLPTLNPSKDPAAEARIRSRVDATNKEWVRLMDVGASATDSLVDTNTGTFKGRLPDDTTAAYELFKTLTETSPQYAATKLGNNTKMFSDMLTLERMGVTSPEMRAKGAFDAKFADAQMTKEDKAALNAGIDTALKDAWKGANGIPLLGWFAGDMDTMGSRAVKREVAAAASLALRSKLAATPAAAVQLAVKQIEQHSVVTENQVMLKSDIPAVPDPYDPRGTLEVTSTTLNRFRSAVLPEIRRQRHMDTTDIGEVKLVPIKGTGGFTVYAGDLPVIRDNGKPLTYNAGSFRTWAQADYRATRETGKPTQSTLMQVKSHFKEKFNHLK